MIPKINAKLCFDDGSCVGNNNNPYYIIDKNNNKKCISSCPKNKPYYKSDDITDIQCFSECPDNYAHILNQYECFNVEQCDSKTIKFNTRECVKGCGKNDKTYEIGDISYFLDNCIISYKNMILTGLLLTFVNKCVSTCPSNSELNDSNICDCSGFYYIDKETQHKKCISENSYEYVVKYSILVSATQECVDYCDGILTQTGKECYRTEYNCIEYYETIKIENIGDKVCDCIEKYYYSYDGNGNQIKTCGLYECPTNKTYKNEGDENECLTSCPGKYKYNNNNE